MNTELGRGESPNVGTRRVVFIMAGILVVLVLIAFGLQPIFRDRIGQTHTVQHAFPAPTVIADERSQRLALEAGQRNELNGAHRHMPIAGAMKAIAAKRQQAFDPIEAGP